MPLEAHAFVRCAPLAFLLCAVACGDKQTAPDPEQGSNTGKTEDPSTAAERAQILKEARDAIGAQLALLESENLEALRATFTEQARGQVTAELVAKARQDLVKTTIEDLVHEAEPGELEGKQTAKVTNRNGEPLTTLIREGDRWLADTVWFR